MPVVFNSSVLEEQTNNRTSFSGANIKAVIYRPEFNLGTNRPETRNGYPNASGLYHELATIQTISISKFRDKYPVRSLGFQNPMGYSRGNRTIAGTLIFALIQKDPFNETATYSEGNRDGILRNSSGFIRTDNVSEDFSFSSRERAVGDNTVNNLSDTAITNLATVNRKHRYDFTWDSQLFGQLMHVDELPPFDIIISAANEAGNTGKLILYGVDISQEGMTLSIEDLYTEVVYQYTARGMAPFEEGSYNGRLWNSDANNNGQANDYALNVLRNR